MIKIVLLSLTLGLSVLSLSSPAQEPAAVSPKQLQPEAKGGASQASSAAATKQPTTKPQPTKQTTQQNAQQTTKQGSKDEPGAQKEPKEFVPSEQIEPNQAVTFPTDI